MQQIPRLDPTFPFATSVRRCIAWWTFVLTLPLVASAEELAAYRLPSSGEEIEAHAAPARPVAPSGRPSALEEALARRPAAGIETFTVGSTADPACDFDDVQSAIDAAAANGSGFDFIRVARNQTYVSQSLTIDSQDLAIFGGYDDCSDTTADGDTTLNGSSGSVFEISGGGLGFGVTLRDLVIQGGDTGTLGGGIRAHSGVRVDLDSTSVRNNTAVLGGGVAVTTLAELFLLPETLVHLNDAVDGGGIFCAGSSVEIRSQSSVFENEASDRGGGIYADACDVESRAGPVGPFLLGVVSNDAQGSGGGIYATGGSEIELRGTATSTALLALNSAASSGGGASLLGSVMEALNASIVENSAGFSSGGVGVFEGSSLVMDQISTTGCNAGGRCSELSRNTSTGSTGTAGFFAAEATVVLRQTYVEGNDSLAPIINLSLSTALLEGVVFADNHWDQNAGLTNAAILFRGSSATAAFFTAWGNRDDPDEALFESLNGMGTGPGPLDLDVLSSIIDETVGTVLGPHDPDTSSILLDCLLVRVADPSLTPYTTFTVFFDDPELTFPSNGDFHLKPTSPAIDYCDDQIYAPIDTDLDGEARGFDAPGVPDNLGPFDLGADEWVESGPIFSDGFESGDTSAWSATVP